MSDDEHEIEIEKGIPIPHSLPREMSGITDILRKMEIGDSILISYAQAQGVASIAQRLKIKIVRYTQPDDRNKVRIWRTL